MKIILAFVSITLFNTVLFAQNDTLPNTQNVIVEIYDVVGVYKNLRDGRGKVREYTSEMKGEIIKYDEGTGILTFKAIDGKMYSFASDKYEYFQYDKEFTSKKKKKKLKVIKPRKESGIGFSAGLSTSALIIPTGFQPDEYFPGGVTGGFEVPVCIKAGVSKYLNKNGSVGLTAEYSLLSSESSYFNAGARYQYLYKSNKNGTFYFPMELKFSHLKVFHNYQYSDPTLNSNNYTDMNTEITINALELNFGQGVSFALRDKKSLSLELMFLKHFILSEKVDISSPVIPNLEHRVNGLKLSLFMNF